MKWIAVITMLLLSITAVAQTLKPVGNVQSLLGRADVSRAGRPAVALAAGDSLYAQDTLRTKKDSALIVIMSDGSRLTLGENNRLVIAEYTIEDEDSTAPAARLELLRGRLRSLVTETFGERRGSFEVKTGNAVMGVQGTEFTVDARPSITRVLVHSSKVSVEQIAGGRRRLLSDNGYAVVRRDQGPSEPLRAPLAVGSGSSRFIDARDPFAALR